MMRRALRFLLRMKLYSNSNIGYKREDGELANENKLKELADYATYKVETSEALPKFKFNGALIKEFKEMLMPEIGSLIE